MHNGSGSWTKVPLVLFILIVRLDENYCKKCYNVSQINRIDASNLYFDLFMDEYAYSGKPLQVKNITSQWKAMKSFDFEFFQNLYSSLENPSILDKKQCIVVRMAKYLFKSSWSNVISQISWYTLKIVIYKNYRFSFCQNR